ncbi:uncharacterized protein MELLADRAFT_69708 [Melampsora larici-populina 98AG31]|uniref:Uncharacterized protein n=1 Tax=Melampsora larici-populina (strain 98AG31 / pathotype 3-4-7) TaxID=747676 RepID=F4SBV3_MELLP|nr:uncharacterized protein MELLADRAFT_69708 [Melampsora larici-populina 98AG31]EGF97864.1 hypothetical protein MELLADRAFT_69708 [Melampsora larici-populina 98AG31]
MSDTHVDHDTHGDPATSSDPLNAAQALSTFPLTGTTDQTKNTGDTDGVAGKADIINSGTDRVTLHSVCGFEVFLSDHVFDTRQLWNLSLPLVNWPELLPKDCNAIMLAVIRGDGSSLVFTSRPAHIQMTNEVVHSSDFRVTVKATLSDSGRQVSIGVRRFNTHEVNFGTYLGVAKSYLHVATNLNRF